MNPRETIAKPIPGDMFVAKKAIDVIDIKGNILALKKGTIITLADIKETASIRLDRNTKFIANWTCKFFYDKRLFILRVQNSAQECMLYEHFEPLTEALAEKLASQ